MAFFETFNISYILFEFKGSLRYNVLAHFLKVFLKCFVYATLIKILKHNEQTFFSHRKKICLVTKKM